MNPRRFPAAAEPRLFRTPDGGVGLLTPVATHRPDAMCSKHQTAAKRVRRLIDGKHRKVWECQRCKVEATR